MGNKITLTKKCIKAEGGGVLLLKNSHPFGPKLHDGNFSQLTCDIELTYVITYSIDRHHNATSLREVTLMVCDLMQLNSSAYNDQVASHTLSLFLTWGYRLAASSPTSHSGRRQTESVQHIADFHKNFEVRFKV